MKEYILTSKYLAFQAIKLIKHSRSFTNMTTHYAQAAHNMLESALLRGCCISTSFQFGGLTDQKIHPDKQICSSSSNQKFPFLHKHAHPLCTSCKQHARISTS